MREVKKLGKAEVYIDRYKNSDHWYQLYDTRESTRDTGDTLTRRQGTFADLIRLMRAEGVRTYCDRTKHKCEHPRCTVQTPYMTCAFHADPHKDVVFCAMTGLEWKP